MEALQISDDSSAKSAHWPGWRLVTVCVVSSLCLFLLATAVGYPSTAIPDLNSHRNPFHLTPQQQSWTVSLGLLAGVFGTLASGLVNDLFGRKFGLLLMTVPMTVSWAVVASATNFATFFAGVCLLGFFGAFGHNTVSTYVTEIAPVQWRGRLNSLHDVFFSLGLFWSYLAGSLLSWNYLAMVSAVPSAVLSLLILLLPESPRWLLVHGDVDQAKDSLARLYPSHENLDAEIQELQAAIKEASAKAAGWKDLFACPLVKWLLVSMMLFAIRELSASHILRLYTVTIFRQVGTTLDPNLATILVGVAYVCGTVGSIFILDRIRRTILYIACLVSMACGWVLFGSCFLVKRYRPSFFDDHLFFFPVTSASGVMFTAGLNGILPHLIANELFSTRVRGAAHTLSLLMHSAVGFATAKVFLDLQQRLGLSGPYWIHAAFCLLGALFVLFFVPETKGKPLENVSN